VPGDGFDLRKFQQEQKDWSKRNFPTQNTPYRPLLGVMEEVGELSHAHLKAEQGIRVNENHQAAKFDAIGDIVIYLSDYCNKNGFDLQDCISKTWDQVKQRDWTKNKINGKE
jgi:NTP pyrophosphatase (non-canonical NTP hydrolase)